MHSEENKMNAANLAIVFAPSLGLNVAVVEVLIERAEEVWPRESGWGWEQLKAVPRYQPLSPKKDRKEDRERPELPPRPSNASEGDRRPPRPPKPVSLSSNNPFAMFSRNAGSLRKTENPFATMRKEISGPKDPIKIGENPFATIKKEREREEDGGEGMEWTRLTGNENGWES